jgi:epsilon-lactone hydrolase
MASPEYHRFIEKLRARPKPATPPPVTEQRAEFEKIAARFALPQGVTYTAVDADGVKAEWTQPANVESGRTILFTHGGGYNIGSVATHRALVGRLAVAAKARALSLDYRLAPEHRCPAPVEDAVTAYRWLLRQGGQPKQIALAGDSAGGGLALATLIALRQANEPLPAAAVCMSPLTDLAKEGESMRTRAHLDPLVTPEISGGNAVRYLGPDGDARNPLGSPLYADLRGLPPLLILVGTWEILHDDSTRFAERARLAGVDVTLEVWEEMIHIWPFYAQFFPEGQQAIDRMGDFIRARVPCG